MQMCLHVLRHLISASLYKRIKHFHSTGVSKPSPGYSPAVVRYFYAIFMQHIPCFCKHKQHGSVWCGMFSVYQLHFIESLEDGRMSTCCIVEKNMLLVKSVFNFFYKKAEFICCKIDLKYPLAAEEVEIISFFLR